MSSGNYASAAGWNHTGKPNDIHAATAACWQADEPRGRGVYLAGLCVVCGRATTRRNRDGQPQHHQLIPAGAAA